jgi:hypothetical protein
MPPRLPRLPSDALRAAFDDALLRAVTEGRMPPRYYEFGPLTWSAIVAIASEHPEASAELIANAFDSFERESSAGDLSQDGHS